MNDAEILTHLPADMREEWTALLTALAAAESDPALAGLAAAAQAPMRYLRTIAAERRDKADLRAALAAVEPGTTAHGYGSTMWETCDGCGVWSRPGHPAEHAPDCWHTLAPPLLARIPAEVDRA